jgi:crotonobetainyl-CoA:carnitine CoA-transferase CaiB-like acyl-CoA transferase
VNTVRDVLENEQVRAIGALTSLPAPGGGHVELTGRPVTFASPYEQAASLAPRLGEHTEAVLREFGLTDQQVKELAADDAF